MEDLLVRLRRGDVILADGAWGTALFDRGLAPGVAPESWTLERPEVLADVARSYVDAGAELVTTNTFGASPSRLRLHGLEDRVDEVNRRAIEIVREAVGDRAYISGSVGPTGRLLQPLGDGDPDALRAEYRRQIAALVGAGADAICVETMTDLREITIAVEAARHVAPTLPIIATMTFEVTRRGPFTVMGISVARAATALEAAGADVVGANCGNGVEEILVVAAEFRRCSRLPLAMQPNAGIPEQRDGRLVYPGDPASFATLAAPLLDGRVSIVGGCCGTTAAHIAALRDALGRACQARRSEELQQS